MNINSNIKTVSGLYDFASDPSIGAVGSLDLSAPVPTGSLVIGAWLTTYIPFTSGGAATLSFGLVQTDVVPPNFFGKSLFFAAAAYGTYVVGTQPAASPLASAALKFYTGSYSLCMAIGTAPITAGKIMLNVTYIQLPF